jgi:hypothetical protein
MIITDSGIVERLLVLQYGCGWKPGTRQAHGNLAPGIKDW